MRPGGSVPVSGGSAAVYCRTGGAPDDGRVDLGVSPRNVRLQTGESGRPELAGDPFAGHGVNVSHSGDWVLCASGPSRSLGVDVEQRRADIDVNETGRVGVFAVGTRRARYVRSGDPSAPVFRHLVPQRKLSSRQMGGALASAWTASTWSFARITVRMSGASTIAPTSRTGISFRWIWTKSMRQPSPFATSRT